MTFEIHFTLPTGEDDCVVVEGNTVEEIRKIAEREVKQRNGSNPWSKEIQ